MQLIPSLTLTFLSGALLWTVFARGGVYPADWSITLLAIAGVSLFCLLTNRNSRAPSIGRGVLLLVLAVPVYVAFQLLPLPLPVLHLLSPARESIANAASFITPIARAPLSVNPPAAVLKLFTWIAYILTFLILREVSWQFRARPWIPLIPLLCLAFIEAGIGILQVSNDAPNPFADGTYTNRDHYSGFLEMILPLTVVAALAAVRNRRRRSDFSLSSMIAACALSLLSILILLSIFASLSRAGFVVALLSLFLVGALSLPARTSRPFKFLWLGICTLSAIVFFIFFPPGELIARFAEMSSEKVSADARPLIWRETLSLIAEFLWFGCGLGGYESAFLKHQAVAAAFSVQFAHNDYLQYLAELGIVGFSLLLAAIAAVLIPVLRGLKRLTEQDNRLILVACLGGIGAIALHSFVDFNTYVPANSLTLAWIMGVASSHTQLAATRCEQK